jgi:hypothetical protein
MMTINPLPPPSVPARGQVQRTFVAARVLAGFADPTHFEQLIAGEYLAKLSAEEKGKVLAAAQAAREFVAGLSPVSLDNVIIRPLNGPHVDAIQADPTFQHAMQGRPFAFAYVRPERLVALQVHVEPRADKVPSGEPELLHFALPHKWEVPAEITLTPPLGPIHIVTSSPMLQGVRMELDAARGRIIVSAPPHLNLVQVAEFQGRYYLRNGYHRVYDAVSSGIKEMPALVMPVINPAELELGGTAFGAVYVAGRPRPPLVADLATPAAMDIELRERRYGVTISLDVKPFSIGI